MKHTYGFIVIPKGDAFSKTEKIIEKYGKELQTPTYLPHLTIMYAVDGEEDEIVRKVRNAVKSTKPFEVKIGEVAFSTTFFQCVFARIKTTAELMNMHLKMKEALDNVGKHVFMPHLSLVYGDFNMEMRERVCQEITLPNLSFMVEEITIVNGDKPDPKTWTIIKKIELNR